MFKTKKWCPLKLRQINGEQKNKIMISVQKLDKQDFRVTKDFSKMERKTIMEQHKRAREKTAREENKSFIWKVRGPWTKLYLKK